MQQTLYHRKSEILQQMIYSFIIVYLQWVVFKAIVLLVHRKTKKLLDLNVKKNKEFWKKIYKVAQNVFDYIQHNESSEYVSDYKHLLDRFFYLYKSHDGNIPKDRHLVTCDQNTIPFPLPKFVDDNRKTIRQWARS